jgi:hypothetical protein
MTGRQTRAERAATPLARDAIRKIAESVGGCLRPVQLRRTGRSPGRPQGLAGRNPRLGGA